MHTYNVSATYQGAPLPVKFTGQKVNEYFAFSIDCKPDIQTPCGWHPHFLAPGYCLPGGVLPSCTVTVVDNAGKPINDFLTQHTVVATIVSTTLKGRLNIQPIVPIQLAVTPLANNKFTLSGTLPPNVGWVKVHLVVDGVSSYDLPLWPVGVPVTLLRGLPNFSGSDFSANPLNRATTDFVPYLAPSLSDQKFNPLYAPDPKTLLSGIDPESFFAKPYDHRQKYNALELLQGGDYRAALVPSINLNSGKILFSAAPGPVKKFIQGYTDPHLKLVSHGPIMLAEQGSLKAIGTEYQKSRNVWVTDFAVNVSSAGLFESNSFSNYVLSGDPLDLTDYSTTLTLTASDPKKELVLGNPLAPRSGDLAIVSFDPTLTRNASLLSFWTNPQGLFFFIPSTLSGTGIITTKATLKTFWTSAFTLPEWLDSMPKIPLYLVTFDQGRWKAFTDLYGVPVSVASTPISMLNPSVTGSMLLTPTTVPAGSSFFPLSVSGSLVVEE